MTQFLNICTIITRDRVAYARTLCDSFLQWHPDGECHVLLLDDPTGCFDPLEERFHTVRLDQLAVPHLLEYRFKYTPFELCCAMKPTFLRHLLVCVGLEHAIYLDSDILVLGPLTDLVGEFGTHDILLTPHIDSDFPADGKRPQAGHILLSGIFNGGFIGVRNSEQGLQFLSWWETQLADRCVVDHFGGYFVDQKFLDLAVGRFDGLRVLTDPGYNVAYWNLHSRTLFKSDDRWYVNGRPLVFFHFSDYRLDRPGEISGHQDRFDFDQLPELESLFTDYLTRLVGNGHDAASGCEYQYARYRNGSRITPGARRAYLKNQRLCSEGDPFDRGNHSLAFRWASLVQGIRILAQKMIIKWWSGSGN